MTKTYALKRLLEHGPMTRAQIVECTGWKRRQVESALQDVLRANLVIPSGYAKGRDVRGGFTYEAAGARGSFPGGTDAGNSRPGLGLFHGAPKGVK